MVTSMDRSLAFYIDGLRFTIQNRHVADGRLRWCWMSPGGAAVMLQEASSPPRDKLAPAGALGTDAAFYFQCRDALAIYREAAARGIHALREPQVGNFAWEVFSPIRTAIKSTSPILPTCPKKPSSPKSTPDRPSADFTKCTFR